MLTKTPIKTKWFCEKCLVFPQLITIGNEMTRHTYYAVECPKCLCHTEFYDTPDEAKAAWDDKRVPRIYLKEENKNVKTDSKKSWDKADVIDIVAGTLITCIILYGGYYVLPREFIKATSKARSRAQRTIAERREEQRKPLPVQYEGRNFHKVILEGHEYWYAENFKNNVGFCHSESCPCKTNKTEIAKWKKNHL